MRSLQISNPITELSASTFNKVKVNIKLKIQKMQRITKTKIDPLHRQITSNKVSRAIKSKKIHYYLHYRPYSMNFGGDLFAS